MALAESAKGLEKVEQERGQLRRKLGEKEVEEISRREQLDRQKKTIALNNEKMATL